jgi:quercetin dioxygenase-like cupin family protein
MRPTDTITHPPATESTWSDAALVHLTIRLATQPVRPLPAWPATALPLPATDPPRPYAGPPTGRVADPGDGVPGLSTGLAGPAGRLWSVPLLVTPEVEAWLVGWPAGLVSRVHGHGGGAEAVTVVDGALSEECLDPTIWTTGRRTTWRAGASTLFPAGHVHLLGAAGGRPALAVHARSRAASADRAAGRPAAPARRAPGGRGPGGGRGPVDPVGVGPGRGRGRPCWADQPLHGAPDLGHVRDRVPV